MHIVHQSDKQHEIDMSTDTDYILSLKIDEFVPPVVTSVPKNVEAVKSFLLEYSDAWKNVEGADVVDSLFQRALFQGIMVGILQCVTRAGDDSIIEQLKSDPDTEFLFTPKEDDKGNDKKINMIAEQQAAASNLSELFESNGLTGKERGRARRAIKRRQAGAKLAENINNGHKRGITKSTKSKKKKK